MKKYEDLLAKTETANKRFEKLSEMIAAPEIIADGRYWRSLLAERESLRDVIGTRQDLARMTDEIKGCREALRSCDEGEMRRMLEEEIVLLYDRAEKAYRALGEATLRSDGGDAVVEIAPIGKDGSLCDVLSEMYRAFCKRENFSCKAVSSSGTVVLRIARAYARLYNENGVHKAVGNNAARSAVVSVFPTRAKEEIVIDERDVRIDLFHSGGAGGQNINKVETAIRLTHLPTGIVVTCQDERSQLQNKNKAFDTLKQKLAALSRKEEEEREAAQRKKNASVLVRTYDFENGFFAGADRKKLPLSELLAGNIPF